MSASVADRGVAEDYAPRTIVEGVIGNVVEWYDWTVYGLMAGVFSPSIFPAHDAPGGVDRAVAAG